MISNICENDFLDLEENLEIDLEIDLNNLTISEIHNNYNKFNALTTTRHKYYDNSNLQISNLNIYKTINNNKSTISKQSNINKLI